MGNLSNSLKAQTAFTFENTNSSNAVNLCLFPGHFVTENIVTGTRTGASSASTIIAHNNVDHITDAGYACNQMADDYDELIQGSAKSNGYVKVTANSSRTKYADFLNFIKLNGLSVTKMRIKNLNSSVDIFAQEIEISASVIGGKAGSDFITLSSYISNAAYDNSFIDIDLSTANLTLDNTTLAFLRVPASAKFSIQFFVE